MGMDCGSVRFHAEYETGHKTSYQVAGQVGARSSLLLASAFLNYDASPKGLQPDTLTCISIRVGRTGRHVTGWHLSSGPTGTPQMRWPRSQRRGPPPAVR